MSAANVVETSMVLRGLKKVTPDKAERWLDDFLEAAGSRIEPITSRTGLMGIASLHPSYESDAI
jgi:uncharacterized protein with PIN domain